MRNAPNFEGLPLTTPLTVAELAAHARKKGGNWPTHRMRRWLLRLNRIVIERHLETGDPRWSPDGFLRHDGRHYMVESLTDFRTKTGWEDFGKTIWTTRDAEAIAGEAKLLRREVRALQARVRELEVHAGQMTELVTSMFRNTSRRWLLRKPPESGVHPIVPELAKTVASFEEDDEHDDRDLECAREA